MEETVSASVARARNTSESQRKRNEVTEGKQTAVIGSKRGSRVGKNAHEDRPPLVSDAQRRYATREKNLKVEAKAAPITRSSPPTRPPPSPTDPPGGLPIHSISRLHSSARGLPIRSF